MAAPDQLFETKSDYAYRRVRELVLTGEVEPGAVIQQRALAAELGISTTPLREALRRLMTEGLVELDSHRDARITPLKAEEARDLLEMRRSLDPLAASLAAGRRTTQDIADIREARQGLQALPQRPNLQQLMHHRRFHAAIYRASHNELLIETLDRLWDKADRYRRMSLVVEPTAESMASKDAEHTALMDAVASGDAGAAAEIMHVHIAASYGAQAMRRLESAAGADPSA